jgi:membrane-associated phospholipid phosphatase
VRPLLALYPPAMVFALVYTGEHYVVDCLAGWVYAVATFFAVNWFFAWRERRVVTIARDAEPEPAFAD